MNYTLVSGTGPVAELQGWMSISPVELWVYNDNLQVGFKSEENR